MAASTAEKNAPQNAFLAFIKKNTVLCIAFCAAVLSACIIPPDETYLSYFDVKTLCCLFGTLAVVCALKNIRFFSIMARRIIRLAGNSLLATIMLVCITFIGSMLIANDMALITFLPLGYLVFSATGRHDEVATVFILQNIAANLGGMVTPFGNPQNLYLYTKFQIPTAEFTQIMFPPFVFAIILILACCFLVPMHSLRIDDKSKDTLPRARTIIYLSLFGMTILMVFRLLPVWLVLTVVVASLVILDRKALTMVDYGLLGTFVCFFVFSGNMGRIPAVRSFFSQLLEKNTLLTAVFSCQIISNVPSAILLSQFTDNYPLLLVGVNIGGAGTLIASLASLITFGEYCAHFPGHAGSYIKRFSLLNFGMVILLTAFMLLRN